MEKRIRERARKEKQQEKEQRRQKRDAEKRSPSELKPGEDPDLADMVPGPQPGQITTPFDK